MHSPAEHQTLPVIVDIILVGRTKIITLHSSIWLTNSTDRHVAFRLHVPITPLVAPARVGPPSRKQRTTDHVIGPLEPGAGQSLCSGARACMTHRQAQAAFRLAAMLLVSLTHLTQILQACNKCTHIGLLLGCGVRLRWYTVADNAAGTYLPLTAVLGGLLFVRVEGYLEADRDVIRLDPDVGTMQAQQGYVCCMPQSVPYRRGQRETYVAPLHCCVRVLPSQVCVHSAPITP